MPNPIYAVPALMLLAAGPAAAPAAVPARGLDWDGAVALLAQHITIHVPRITISTTIVRPAAPARPPRPMFREKKADDCVKMKKIVGFGLSQTDAIDLVLDDETRMRAYLGANCPSPSFYTGFYVKPHADGKICVKRDMLRSRMGKSCAIGQFTKLVPVK